MYTRSTFSQSLVVVFVGISLLGPKELIFFDTVAKINGQYYQDGMLATCDSRYFVFNYKVLC